MNIQMLDIDIIKPYENNPRKIDQTAIDSVAKSILMFGFKQPIVVDCNYEIVVGHTRRLASLQLGLKKVPCLVAEDLDVEQIKAYRLIDNKTSEFSSWNFEKLENELKDIDLNMDDFGFNMDFDNISKDVESSSKDVESSSKDVESDPKDTQGDLKDNYYTDKIVIPTYKPTMEEKPSILKLVNDVKTDQLIKKIQDANIEDKLLENFLIGSAYRFNVFNYHLIAEYYAHADKQIQELFEDLALVIIDYDKAVENGFVEINKKVISEVNNG